MINNPRRFSTTTCNLVFSISLDNAFKISFSSSIQCSRLIISATSYASTPLLVSVITTLLLLLVFSIEIVFSFIARDDTKFHLRYNLILIKSLRPLLSLLIWSHSVSSSSVLGLYNPLINILINI